MLKHNHFKSGKWPPICQKNIYNQDCPVFMCLLPWRSEYYTSQVHWDLITGLVQYSDHRVLSDRQMVNYSYYHLNNGQNCSLFRCHLNTRQFVCYSRCPRKIIGQGARNRKVHNLNDSVIWISVFRAPLYLNNPKLSHWGVVRYCNATWIPN